MKKVLFSYTILYLLSSLFLATNSYSKEITYDGDKAKEYAERHCGSPDPYSKTNGYNFSEYKCWNGTLTECENHPSKIVGRDKNGNPIYGNGKKTDCANFVSQSMINGGLDFNSKCIKGDMPPFSGTV